mgnify:CR=1 FL=1
MISHSGVEFALVRFDFKRPLIAAADAVRRRLLAEIRVVLRAVLIPAIGLERPWTRRACKPDPSNTYQG